MPPDYSPTAATISIRQTLDLFDGPFAPLAKGVADRRYAFWLGSGISRDRLDDLKKVLARILTFLRDRIDPASATCAYRRALDEVLSFGRLSDEDRVQADYSRRITEWPILQTLLRNLASDY